MILTEQMKDICRVLEIDEEDYKRLYIEEFPNGPPERPPFPRIVRLTQEEIAEATATKVTLLAFAIKKREREVGEWRGARELEKEVTDKPYAEMSWTELQEVAAYGGTAVGRPIACLIEALRRLPWPHDKPSPKVYPIETAPIGNTVILIDAEGRGYYGYATHDGAWRFADPSLHHNILTKDFKPVVWRPKPDTAPSAPSSDA